MRAVNLVPSDLRRAGSGGGSGSGVGAYILLGVLAAAVLVAATWAVTTRQVNDREAEVARLNAEAQAAETQAANLAGYEQTVKVADARRGAVVDLINARFSWSAALRDLSRTVPEGVSLTSMNATVSAGAAVEGGTTNPLRASLDQPAVSVDGCAPSQDEVAKLISRLRAMKGVAKVALSSSQKTDGGGSSDSAGGSGDCTAGSDQRPRFSLVVFYDKPAGAASAPADGETTTASTTTTTPAAGSTK